MTSYVLVFEIRDDHCFMRLARCALNALRYSQVLLKSSANQITSFGWNLRQLPELIYVISEEVSEPLDDPAPAEAPRHMLSCGSLWTRVCCLVLLLVIIYPPPYASLTWKYRHSD
ncbi:hypothetical protein P691DRAFT_801056, partial [Macrolepiota fuliginosa MF-IS2]